MEIRWKTVRISKKRSPKIRAYLWVSMAEPSHLEHMPAILKLWFSPLRKMWSPVGASLSATLGSSGSVTPSQACCPGYFPPHDWGRTENLSSSLSERREPRLKAECWVIQPEETNPEHLLQSDIAALLKHDFAWCSSRPMWRFFCLGWASCVSLPSETPSLFLELGFRMRKHSPFLQREIF